jgi:hypothetical protein
VIGVLALNEWSKLVQPGLWLRGRCLLAFEEVQEETVGLFDRSQ